MNKKFAANLDFLRFVSRHGEAATQAILETLERYEGVRPRVCVPLEERWDWLMSEVPDGQHPTA